jgi:hypothetical protein
MDTIESPHDRPQGPEAPGRTIGTYLGALAAVLSAAAGAVHLGYAPHHLDEDWAHGWFFVAVGAAQIAFAVLVVARPRPWLWRSALVLNAFVIVTWAVSRTVGLPVGPEALRTEDAAAPDIVCSLLEAGVVLLAGLALAFPERLSRPVHDRWSARVTVAALSVGAVVVAAVMLTPAYVDAHGSGDAHAHADGATDTHDHATTVALDGSTPCEQSGPAASPGQVATDAEGHSHRGPSAQQPLTEAERLQLADQQALAREAALRYPTVADAEAAGYRMSVAYVPCIGAHYTNFRLALSFDPARPSELLFDGTAPDSKIVGLSYLVRTGASAPDGFAGPNDQWHQHNSNGGLCMKGGVVAGGEALSDADCAARGGQKVSLDGVWMLHDWVVPGWECSWGVFAGECPELGGRTGGTAWDPPAPEASADGLQALGG